MRRKLILAEKPAVARDLARVLGVPQPRAAAGSFEGPDYVITWCVGHLVELEEPAAYEPAWRRWFLASLPMLPERFQLRPIKQTQKQWRVVKGLLRDRDFAAVINACDAGREGELIFRLCYELAGCRLPIERLWISSLTEQAIRAGLGRLRPGRELDALGDAARCRAEADWLVGMNATRAVTLRRRERQDVLCSIGRVQTPTLSLLVQREREIEAFVPRDYFEVHADLHRHPPQRFTAIWHLGPARRLAKRPLAEEVLRRSRAAAVPVVESVESKTVREPPPLLFDLTALQRTANRRFGFSAQRTLEVAQALYEKHKLITYPRTDSRYLTSDLVPQLPRLFAALAEEPSYAPLVAPLADRPPPPSRRVFRDDRARDHHAIVPTATPLSPQRMARLDGDERRLLDLIARRFLGAFYPDAEFQQTRVVVRVGDDTGPPRRKPKLPDRADAILEEMPDPPDRYVARGRVRVRAGWQEVAGFGAEPPEAQRDADAEPTQALPPLSEGDLLGGSFRVEAGRTQPPPRYNEATLLSAMETAGRHLDDEELRQQMKEVGLGTPATRAAIIETLLQRAYVERRGKLLHPTPLGIDLVEGLPVPSLASPELTGRWEARLDRIARGQDSRPAFMADIERYVREIVDAVRGAPAPQAVPVSAPAAAPPPRRIRKDAGAGQTARAGVKAKVKSHGAAPAPPSAGHKVVPELACPRCREGQMIVGRRGWGCSRWQRGCPLVIPFQVLGLRLCDSDLRKLCEHGATDPLGPRQARLRLALQGSPAGFVYLDTVR